MTKFSALALFACLAMSVVSTGAEAARFAPPAPAPAPTPTSTSTIKSDSNPCMVDCLQIVVPPRQDCAVHKVVTLAPARTLLIGTPKKDTCASASSEFKACGDKLDNLRRVTVAQVRRIDDNDKVHLVPLCDIVHRSLTQIETTYLARGNVQGLILPISQNDTLMAALDGGGYRANNVLGIVRGQDAVILYVSRAPF